MAWDSDKQFQSSAKGIMIETGYATLGDDGTVEVSTFLSRIITAHVTYKSGGLLAGALICDGTITGGAVTITDSAGAANADAEVYYTFMGFR